MFEEWIDRNGLIKPQKDWTDSGNGILYTAVYLMVTQFSQWEGFRVALWNCDRGGLLYRTPPTKENPHGSYGQEQWDDYLGYAAICIMKNFHTAARQIIFYGIRHFGFYNTDGKLEGKDWLWRFPQIWVLFWIAGFPWLKWSLYPLARVVGMFMHPDPSDQSGTQLAWVYHRLCLELYGSTFIEDYQRIAKQFSDNISKYYGDGHPTVRAYLALYERERIEGWKCIEPT